MIISITTKALANSRPNAIGSNTIGTDYGVTHTFTLANFTSETSPQYSDPENDLMSYVYVITLPSSGTLISNNVPVSIGDKILSGTISTGNLTFTPDNSQITAVSTSFEFDLADEGSSDISGLGPGVMSVNVSKKTNEAPSSVGDNTLSLNYGVITVFTKDNFTIETTPVYVDPEGDEPYSLKILSTPLSGGLYLNNNLVTLNQEVLFTEIDAGYFAYVPDLSLITAQSYSFTFSISDVGSKTFTT
jgi:hypothetical protein